MTERMNIKPEILDELIKAMTMTCESVNFG